VAKRSQSAKSPKLWQIVALISAIILLIVLLILLFSPNSDDDSEVRNIATGMTNFYIAIRGSSLKPHERERSDYVIELDLPSKPLAERLLDMELVDDSYDPNWIGDFKYRTFSEGSTLRKSISQFAEKEGMRVIWELEQDFVIKAQFQLEDTIIGSVRTLSSGINNNFEGKVRSYVCPKPRTIVITTEPIPYLVNNCTKV
jgi:hypothetical protein